MKKIARKPWFIGSIMVVISIVVLFINLQIISLDLVGGYYSSLNVWQIANSGNLDYETIFSIIFKTLFFGSIFIVLLSGISIWRKSNWGFILSHIYFFIFELLFLSFQLAFKYLSSLALSLVIVNAFLLAISFAFYLYRAHLLKQEQGEGDIQKVIDDKKRVQAMKRTALAVLIIDVMTIIILLSMFIVPLYSQGSGASATSVILGSVLFSSSASIEQTIYFMVTFAMFVGVVFYFASCLSNYFYSQEKFIEKSKALVFYSSSMALIFFLLGLGISVYYNLKGVATTSVAYIPMAIMTIVIFAYSILKGRFDLFNQTEVKVKKIRYYRIEPLIYVFILTAVTVASLFFNVVKIDITWSSYSEYVRLTGITILRDYATLDASYRAVAFLLIIMLISSGLCLILTIASYLAKYTKFNSIVKTATFVNVFFLFVIGISGFYFSVAKDIDRSIIESIFDHYGISIPSGYEYEYKVSTDVVYSLLVSVLVTVIMFLRKAFETEQIVALEADLYVGGSKQDHLKNSELGAGDATDEGSAINFDPCPAFTDLDSKVDKYKEEMALRNEFKVKETSLNELVNFVVDYARNSRLHLSYTPENIATFIAGLGAAKLSILQGMSGTGKTSLPKIFSEAIFGNCEIIEVESSWKDKNELLGYYNEFSMKYTPKKFTQSLYKAALNKDIFTFIVLDEMNLSRIEYYFSDFLSLMENEEDRREIKLININLARDVDGQRVDYLALNNGNTLKVPPNIWFIGTANRDESTFVISDKVYDRAHTMNFTKRAAKVRNYQDPISRRFYDYETINNLLSAAKQKGHFDAENNEIIRSVEALLSPFNISFGNRILKQIEDFVNVYTACFPNEKVEDEAVEAILLSKVVAKLEVKAIDDKEKLVEDFQKLHLERCADFIRHLDGE
ncbi:MAG: hypothetical protein WCQ71_01680 [Bacilli bacterium]